MTIFNLKIGPPCYSFDQDNQTYIAHTYKFIAELYLVKDAADHLLDIICDIIQHSSTKGYPKCFWRQELTITQVSSNEAIITCRLFLNKELTPLIKEFGEGYPIRYT